MDNKKSQRQIVVLDAYTLCQGNNRLLLNVLGKYGHVTLYDRTAPEQLYERAVGADFLFTNKVVIDATAIDALPKLQFIGVLATGYNIIDVAAARRRGILVCNVPGYSTESVAQMVFAHILAVTHRVSDYAHEVRTGEWNRQPDFCYRKTQLIELWGKTMGLVGFGHIGQAVARIALGFGMKVLAVTRKQQDELPYGVQKVNLEEVFALSDIVSLHCPLTEENRQMVNVSMLDLMKPTALLINTARGGLIDEQALADALKSRRIWAAGLDVLSKEPPQAGHPLVGLDNCFITPHVAWATEEAITRCLQIIDMNLAAAIGGHPINNVAQ